MDSKSARSRRRREIAHENKKVFMDGGSAIFLLSVGTAWWSFCSVRATEVRFIAVAKNVRTLKRRAWIGGANCDFGKEWTELRAALSALPKGAVISESKDRPPVVFTSD